MTSRHSQLEQTVNDLTDKLEKIIEGLDSRLVAMTLLSYASALHAKMLALGIYDQVDIEAIYHHAVFRTTETVDPLANFTNSAPPTDGKLN